MTKHFAAVALALSIASIATTASAQTETQSTETPRGHAFVVNGGPMIGFLGGIYWRVNPEIQWHRDDRYLGHMLGLGLAIVPWPNQQGLSVSFAPRYQYDHQLVAGTPFYVSPYVGLDVGVGIFNIFNGGEARIRFVAAPIAGLDIKVILGRRMIITFRPIGVTVPTFWGDQPIVTADVLYDIALGMGFVY